MTDAARGSAESLPLDLERATGVVCWLLTYLRIKYARNLNHLKHKLRDFRFVRDLPSFVHR